MKYSISIIIPILNEINSLRKTLLIIDKIKVEKEFIIIFSQRLTSNLVKKTGNTTNISLTTFKKIEFLVKFNAFYIKI